jgi:hypothetical protein
MARAIAAENRRTAPDKPEATILTEHHPLSRREDETIRLRDGERWLAG